MRLFTVLALVFVIFATACESATETATESSGGESTATEVSAPTDTAEVSSDADPTVTYLKDLASELCPAEFVGPCSDAIVAAGQTDLPAMLCVTEDSKWYMATRAGNIGDSCPEGGTILAVFGPEPAAFTIIEVNGASPNSMASVIVETTPGETCSLSYRTPAGTESNAEGLGEHIAGDDGRVSWEWLIGPSTNPGEGTIRVRCGDSSESMPITIG